MGNLVETLRNEDVGKVVEHEPLSKHTTIKVGGPADIYVEPKGIDQLMKVMDIIAEEKADWFIIGRGSNLLVRDGGVSGVVINLAKGIDHLDIDGELIRAGGGYPLVKLATVISKKGLSGLEFAGGIPGSVGGAVFMNAGAHGSDMSRIVTRARVLFPDGTLTWLSNVEMHFSYRSSVLQKKRGIVIEVEMKMSKGDKEQIIALMKKYKEYRRQTQPWSDPCCGSVFRNPLPDHAGALIEKAGLKGKQIGGAQISKMHGNFIVNKGGATAKDILDLIALVKSEMKRLYGIDLKTEVEIIGKP